MANAVSNQSGLQVIAYDDRALALFAYGTAPPADNQTGFAPGCIFIRLSNGTLYWNNTSSLTACNFDAITLP